MDKDYKFVANSIYGTCLKQSFVPESRFFQIEKIVVIHTHNPERQFCLKTALEYAKIRYKITGMTSRPILRMGKIEQEKGAYISDIIFTLNTVAELDCDAKKLLSTYGF